MRGTRAGRMWGHVERIRGACEEHVGHTWGARGQAGEESQLGLFLSPRVLGRSPSVLVLVCFKISSYTQCLKILYFR